VNVETPALHQPQLRAQRHPGCFLVSEPVDAALLGALLREIGALARVPARVYLSGAASAVLIGWRDAVPAIDLRFEPEEKSLLRALPALSLRLWTPIRIAAPTDHLPELPGWRRRSRFIRTAGCLDFHHYDFHAQALERIERNQESDVRDVVEMIHRHLIDPRQLLELFYRIEPNLHRHPAIDAPLLRVRLEAIIQTTG
jgi:predicted HicB family RNase H-like nuclease